MMVRDIFVSKRQRLWGSGQFYTSYWKMFKVKKNKEFSNSLLVLRNLLSLQPGYFFWKVFKKNRHNSSVCRYLSNLCEIKKENDAQNSSRQIRRPNPNKSRYIFMQIQPSYNKKSYKIWQIKLTLHASFVEIFELDMNTWELDTSVEKGVLNTSSEFCWHFPHFPHCPHCPLPTGADKCKECNGKTPCHLHLLHLQKNPNLTFYYSTFGAESICTTRWASQAKCIAKHKM